MLTVKQLSKLAGVTPRTLHHYDAIGLLNPSRVGDNGYRYYDEQALLRLQQILFYRELDMPLEDIKKIMGSRDFDIVDALESHKAALRKQSTRLKRLILTVDNTILHLKGQSGMSGKDLFAGFTDEEQEKYQQEIAQTYDPEIVKGSEKKWKAYTAQEKARIGDEGKAVYLDLVAAIGKGASSAEAQSAVARWHKHIQYFWTPKDEHLLGLVALYNDDPRFRGKFDQLSPELAEFMRAAVRVYVERRQKR